MKKLSALIALFLCVTIGGVYATWTYAGSDDIVDSFAEAKVTITDATLSGSNGTYEVTSNLVLTIDDTDNNHKAELVFASNNAAPIHLTVKFTPAIHAPQAIKDAGVESELYFGTTTEMKYRGTPIFTFTNPGDGDLNNIFTWEKQLDGTFTYTLDEDDLKAQIALTEAFFLDTKAEHDEFRIALAGNIVARVTDGTIN